mmetsp:Transcript_46597/g.150211  ORF Transcript_46597/g.150211 Transcript_46597/m.150211 type:complete len:306 (-) Transcript_46597:152-1069(-)
MIALLLLQPAAQPTGTALTASNSENLVSGMVSNGDYRIYNVEKCDYNVTLFSVYPVFAAHQIEWNTMGKTMAWWSVLIGLPKTADISETEKVRFYASGAKHVAKVAKGLHLTGKRVLDFGCGLGRLSFAFANQLGATVTCVDQSVHHLRIAEQEWAKRKKAGAVEFVASSPDLLAPMAKTRFDFVHSVIALQHMVPALQVVYLEQLCDLLIPGGSGWLQIPHKTPGADTGCDMGASIRQGGMQMHSTPLHALKKLFRRRGCRADITDAGRSYIGDDAGRSAFVKLRKRKAGGEPGQSAEAQSATP